MSLISDISIRFGSISCVLAICLSKVHHSFQFLLQKLFQYFHFALVNRKVSGKSVLFINNDTALLGYRILIISIRYPTIRFNSQSENVDLLICPLSMTSLQYQNVHEMLHSKCGTQIFMFLLKVINISNLRCDLLWFWACFKDIMY